MARGWESKSVEEQQSLESEARPSSSSTNNQDAIAASARRRQELVLQRERILGERTSSPVRRAALQAALAEIESRIAQLP